MTMKPETAWRTKLIREFKASHPDSFIWAMDAKFKAGFPDLYCILPEKSGGARHYELKVVKRLTGKFLDSPLLLCDRIQISVMKSILRAEGRAYALILESSTQNVYLVEPDTEYTYRFLPQQFKDFWSTNQEQIYWGILK